MPQATSSSPSRAQIISAFAAVYIIWGSTYLAIRFAIDTLPPFFMAGIRFLIAGMLLFVWARMRGASKPTRANWRATAIIGGLLLMGGNGGVTWAEQFIPSGLVALLVALVPAWVVLIDWLRPGGIRPTMPMIAGVALGVVGMILLVSQSNNDGAMQLNPWGALAVIAATIAWSLGTVYSRHAALPEAPLLATSMEMLAGGALLMLASLLRGEWATVDLADVSLSSLVALLYLIVFGSIVAFSAYTWLLKVTTPARAATYAYVNPVVAVILGWLLAGETLSLQTIIAAAIIVIAVVIITTYRARLTVATAADPAATSLEEAPKLLPVYPEIEEQGAK